MNGVGSGMEPPGRDKHEISLLEAAPSVPGTLISGIGSNQDLVCRIHGQCSFGPELDSELGNLIRPNPNAIFNYTRYDHQYTASQGAAFSRKPSPSLPADQPLVA